MSDSDADSASPGIFNAESSSKGRLVNVHTPVKRKREDDSKPEKAKKRRKSKKPADVDDAALDTELGVNHALAGMDSQLMADHLARRTKKFNPDLTSVELDEIHIPNHAILDTTSWDKQRIAENLADFVEQFAKPRRRKKGPKLSDAVATNGCPHTLVLAAAGLRAADLTRSLRRFQTKDVHVTKLFAKHIKLKEAIETVESSRINIGVGTPQRVFDLLENGALSAAHLERIVVDASHIDQKKRGILDMRETHLPLVQLLTRAEFRERYASTENRLELILF